MVSHASPQLYSSGHQLDTSPECFGELCSSLDLLEDTHALHTRIERDGYLYLPGFWSRDEVLKRRIMITDHLAEKGLLNLDYPKIDAVVKEDVDLKSVSTHFKNKDRRDSMFLEMSRLLFSGKIMTFLESYLGGAVQEYEYTWFRIHKRGMGTKPHCDIVFFNRGTHNIYSAWVPYGDIDQEMGGLMILEDSHNKQHRLRNYLKRDSDTYCENRKGAEDYASQETKVWSGMLTGNPVKLREKLTGRWLRANYRMGDLLLFPPYTVHCSLDNNTDRFRLSTDTRYQLASDPYDERWIGPNPVGHEAGGKRGVIC
jgi:hypothetical protein